LVVRGEHPSRETLNMLASLFPNMFKKLILACVFILFFCFLRLDVGFGESGEGSTIRVPYDYLTIGWAVGNATDGDTILVASGVYQENVIVDKALRIVGEEANTTIIDGGGYDWNKLTKGFVILSENVSIENFTVRNAFYGLYVENGQNIILEGNVLTLNFYGAQVNCSHGVTIQSNHATNNTYGISLWSCSNCTVRNNTAINNYGGVPDLRYGAGVELYKTNDTVVINNYFTKNLAAISLEQSNNNTIVQNEAIENKEPVYGFGYGIEVYSSHENIVTSNTVVANGIGIVGSRNNVIRNNFVSDGGGIGAGMSLNNVFCENVLSGNSAGFSMEKARDFFVGNLIVNNTYGFFIHFSNGSTFYHNVLINNTKHVPKDVYTNVNVWDNGYEGNYWSNYTGADADLDAIGDAPHVLDEFNMDRYPLMAPINIFDAGTWNNTQHQIHIISNSTITNFQLNKAEAIIRFNVTGETPSTGFCRITIPNPIVQDMWNNNYTVLIDNTEPTFQKNWTDTANTYIYIAYQHSEHTITITPEYPTHTLLLTTLMLLLTTIIIHFSKTKEKTFNKNKPEISKSLYGF